MLYGVWKTGGYTGLTLWFWVVASMLIVAGYLLCSLYSGNCKVAFIGGVLVWLFSTIGLAIRPHLIGNLILLLELLAIQLGRTRSTNWFLAVPVLLAFWVNFHSSYLLGLIVLSVILLFSFVRFEAGLLCSTPWARNKRRMLSAAFLLSLVAPFVNPIGWKLAWYPLDNMLHQGLNFASVDEWQQISFSDPRGMALLAVGALVILIPLLRGIKLDATELVLVAVGFWLAVQHERMLFIFGILAAPVFCRLLATAWDQYDPRRDNPVGSGIVLALVALAIGLAFPSQKDIEEQIRAHNPVKAVDYLKNSGLPGNMLNEFVFGGYLIWAAPERKVAIDGRGDLYESAGILQQYGRWALLQADPNEFLNKYAIKICFLSRSAPMTRVLPLLPGWKKVYSDDLAVIFARRS